MRDTSVKTGKDKLNCANATPETPKRTSRTKVDLCSQPPEVKGPAGRVVMDTAELLSRD